MNLVYNRDVPGKQSNHFDVYCHIHHVNAISTGFCFISCTNVNACYETINYIKRKITNH